MASQQAEALKDAMRQFGAQISEGRPTLAQQREAGEQFGAVTSEPEGVTYTPVDVAGIPGRWIEPEGAAANQVLLFLHGGGYVLCSVDSHRKLVGHVARAVGCRALAIDYRLAPEHPHPAAVEDATTAYRWLLAKGFVPSRMALAGDSAGGGLVMATLIKLRDEDVALPAAAVTMSPWVDLEGAGETMTTRADVDLMVQQAGLKVMADVFLQGQDARDPLASPLHGDLAGLPPLYIQVGDEETLLDDARRLAVKARAAGVDVRLDVFPEMQHVFQIAAGAMPEADDAVARIGAWLAPRLAR